MYPRMYSSSNDAKIGFNNRNPQSTTSEERMAGFRKFVSRYRS